MIKYLLIFLLLATPGWAATGDFSWGSANEFQGSDIQHPRTDWDGSTGVVCYTDGGGVW